MAQLYEVVPASVRHVKALSQTFRPAACETLRYFSNDVRRGLHGAFRASFYSRTALIDGKPVAMWGLQGCLLNDSAVAWAALGDAAVRYPVAVVRRAMSELAQFLQDGTSLEANVAHDDKKAIRFARTLGFCVTGSVDRGFLPMKLGDL
jgi:hypothetical protein